MTAEDFSTAFTDPHSPAGCTVPGCMHGKWAGHMEFMARFDPVTAGMLASLRGLALCKGKTFEHHEQIIATDKDPAIWECCACGTKGDFREPSERLMRLIPQIEAVRLAMNLYPALMLPSDSPPGFVGDFMGCKVYRVQGIERPMVAVPGA